MIPQAFINDLLARIDIVEVIGSRVKLRKAGNNYVALCPFHNEKTPSFSVNSNKQFYYCFGCKACGNVISFLMHFENLSFVDAVEDLAANLGIEVEKSHTDSLKKQQFVRFYKIMENVTKFYQQQLARVKIAQNYLRGRGISGHICKQFGIGYAPNGFQNLQAYSKNQESLQNLIETGMLLDRNNRIYSRFRNRIMFPIRDRRGRVIGFGGRALSGDDQVKYLNSPETILFHKGSELYGLYEARQSNRNLQSLIVVEGYMDVVALAQYGVTNVVAALGTAITSKQIQHLLRFVKDITFCFDGDFAGKTAAWRALENILPLMREGISIKFVFLPDGEDPDTLIRKESADAFMQRISNGILLSDFFFKALCKDLNLDSIDGRAMLAKKANAYLQKMADGIFKQLLLEKLAELVKMDLAVLKQQLVAAAFSRSGVEVRAATAVTPASAEFSKNTKAVQNAINLLLHYPHLAQVVVDTEGVAELTGIDVKLLIKLIILLKEQQNFTIGAILEYYRDTEFMGLLTQLAMTQPIIPEDGLKNELIGTIDMLRKKQLEQKIHELLRKAATVALSSEEKLVLQKLIQQVKN